MILEDPLQIWAVSDGRAGIEAQVVGLADAVARLTPAEVTVKRVSYKGAVGKLPTSFNLLPRRALADPAAIAPPWPDLWIAAGRASLPLSARVRRWSEGKTFVVQLQDPRLPPRLFDLVIPPLHDQLGGEGVFPILGSPHRLTPKRLAADLAVFEDQLAPLPSPKVAVLIGGKSSAFDLSPERAAELAKSIRKAVEKAQGSLLMTFSRRTPEGARAILDEALKDLPGLTWRGEGPNPYFAFLAAADFILVTEDSVNMATEAASTGKPVFILPMDGESEKFRRFHEELQRRGASRPFKGALKGWSYPPLEETGRAASEILRRLAKQGRLPRGGIIAK